MGMRANDGGFRGTARVDREVLSASHGLCLRRPRYAPRPPGTRWTKGCLRARRISPATSSRPRRPGIPGRIRPHARGGPRSWRFSRRPSGRPPKFAESVFAQRKDLSSAGRLAWLRLRPRWSLRSSATLLQLLRRDRQRCGFRRGVMCFAYARLRPMDTEATAAIYGPAPRRSQPSRRRAARPLAHAQKADGYFGNDPCHGLGLPHIRTTPGGNRSEARRWTSPVFPGWRGRGQPGLPQRRPLVLPRPTDPDVHVVRQGTQHARPRGRRAATRCSDLALKTYRDVEDLRPPRTASRSSPKSSARTTSSISVR